MSGTRILSTSSKALSAILHPVLVPVWTMAGLMACGVLLPAATVQARGWFILVVALNTVVVPGVCTFLFNRLRFRRETPDTDLRQRILPMAVILVCYIACLVMIRDVPFAYPVRKMLAAGIGCLVFGLGTTPFMKVSMHMATQGAAVAFLGVAASSAGGMMPMLCGAIALASILASAQLYLDAEDVRQSAAGFAGGFVSTLLIVLFM